MYLLSGFVNFFYKSSSYIYIYIYNLHFVNFSMILYLTQLQLEVIICWMREILFMEAMMIA